MLCVAIFRDADASNTELFSNREVLDRWFEDKGWKLDNNWIYGCGVDAEAVYVRGNWDGEPDEFAYIVRREVIHE